jgi:hypothetical protein
MADPIKTAKKIFDQFLSRADPASMPNYDPRAKDSQAQAAGRMGGIKGAVARTRALSRQKRRSIAQRAAKVRWSTRK